MPEEFADYRKDDEVAGDEDYDAEDEYFPEDAVVAVEGKGEKEEKDEGKDGKDKKKKKRRLGVYCAGCHMYHPHVIKGTRSEDEMYRAMIRCRDKAKMFFCSPVCCLAMALDKGVRYLQIPDWDYVERVFYARNKHKFTRTDMLRHRRLYLNQRELLLTSQSSSSSAYTLRS